jgi:toxin ParE1/3/4
MAYKIIISPRAQKEIENAIDFYALYSNDAPRNFITTLKKTYQILSENPFSFRVRFKSVRALKLNKFPYSLYFDINKSQNTIKVLSCFHNKRDPNKRPKY